MRTLAKLSLLPASAVLLLFAGCSDRAYRNVPQALGIPYASRTVTDTQVIIEKDGHTFVFDRGKRMAKVDGVNYFLNEAAGMRTLNRKDSALLRAAVVQDFYNVKTNPVIMLDAGHGGKDTGCRAADKVTFEKDITLSITNQVAEILRGVGYTVLFTRTDSERTWTLDERTLCAANNDIDAFVSIHVNSTLNLESNGVEVYTLPIFGCEGTAANSPARGPLAGHAHLAAATRLALAIQREMIGMENPPADRGVKHMHFKVLRDTPAPSVLVETGFITHAADLQRLTSPEGQAQLARAIATGIQKTFSV